MVRSRLGELRLLRVCTGPVREENGDTNAYKADSMSGSVVTYVQERVRTGRVTDSLVVVNERSIGELDGIDNPESGFRVKVPSSGIVYTSRHSLFSLFDNVLRLARLEGGRGRQVTSDDRQLRELQLQNSLQRSTNLPAIMRISL